MMSQRNILVQELLLLGIIQFGDKLGKHKSLKLQMINTCVVLLVLSPSPGSPINILRYLLKPLVENLFTFQLPVRVIFLALTAFEGVDYHHEDPVVVGLGYHVLSHQGPWLNLEQHQLNILRYNRHPLWKDAI